MNKYTIAFDVGGLFIKAAVLNNQGEICKDTVMVYPAKSQETKDELLRHLSHLVEQQAAIIMDKYYRIQGIGYAFPGPFDYENGICYIRGQSKFDHIYGVNLRKELTKRLKQSRAFGNRMTADFRIMFENDANLFALGELLSGNAKSFDRSICLTIGTGTGSAFLDRGEIIRHRQDVPDNGWVYRTPFRDSVVDDYISKRGIVRLADQAGLSGVPDVKELADMARNGHRSAVEVFSQFGTDLGEMLRPFVDRFQPQALIIGGQIAKSGDLFETAFKKALDRTDVGIVFVDRTSLSAFIGVYRLLQGGSSQAASRTTR